MQSIIETIAIDKNVDTIVCNERNIDKIIYSVNIILRTTRIIY